MTDKQAETVANLVLGVGVAGAAYYVLKTPKLRRMAWQLARAALTGTVPAWFGTELKRAWAESGPHAVVTRRPHGAL